MSDLIIVDITENERNTIDGASIQKDISGSGKIAVKNPSQTSRLWNITCDVKENVNTTLESRELNIGILDPSQEYVKEYEIHNLKEPSLKVVEVFDTEVSISGTVNTAFLYKSDNICMLKITLSNPLDTPISSIKLVREIPTFFQDIDIKNPNIGTAGITENEGLKSLNWDIITLEGKQTANLEVACRVNVQDNELKELGNLNVSYIINNYKLSLVNPEIRGLTDSMSGIDRDEGSRPGIWDCNVEFINESDFQVRLEDVKVTHKIPTGIETVVSQAPNRLLNPDQSWEFEFQIESKDVPELNSSIEFTPLYVVITRVLGEISKQSTVYPVLSANIEKTINPPEVDAYANTDMSIENLVMNNGSSNIDVLNIVDEIPQDFIPPSFDQIKITLGQIDISSRQEYTRKLTIEPADQNPDVAHRLVIELINLSQHLIPDSKLVFSYPLLARNPRPPTESLYKTPVKIEVNSPVEGNLFTKMPDEEPEIKVRYVKRKLKTLKSIKPGMNEGEFSISVRIQNKGNVELENILVKEKIPKGFSLTEVSHEKYDLINLGDESEVRILIEELNGNETFSLNYNCSGTGEYPRYEPEVIVQGRETESAPTQQEGSGSSIQTIEGEITAISEEKKAIINDLFAEIKKKIELTIPAEELGTIIENLRDQFPPGPVKHQLMQYAKDIKIQFKDKLVIGSFRDEVIEKLNEFKQKYS